MKSNLKKREEKEEDESLGYFVMFYDRQSKIKINELTSRKSKFI